MTDDSSPFGVVQHSLEELGEAPSFGAFRLALEMPFQAALEPNNVVGWLRRELQELAADAATHPGSVSGNPAAIWSGPTGRLSLNYVTQTSRALNSYAFHQALGLLNGELEVRKYEHVRRTDPAMLTRDDCLRPNGDQMLSVGDTLWVEAGHEVIEVCSGSGTLLYLESAPVHTTRWMYDPETLRPEAMIAATPALGRVEDGILMLRQIGDPQHAEVFEALAEHKSHSVRWAAIRAAVAIHHVRGLRLLEGALEDEHPHVRRAARTALAAIEGANTGS